MNMKRIAMIAMAVVAASATAAPAGTKYAANLVSNSPVDPPPNPTLSVKSSVKLDDKGNIQVSLAGVTDGSGALVTTSTSYNDTKSTSPVLDGTEYIVIIKLFVAAVPAFDIELPVPVDLKAGKGKTKLSAAPLFALITPPAGRTVEIRGSEVWGPLGAPNAAACQAVVANSLPVGLPLGATCRGGTQIGMSGLSIPTP